MINLFTRRQKKKLSKILQRLEKWLHLPGRHWQCHAAMIMTKDIYKRTTTKRLGWERIRNASWPSPDRPDKATYV